VSHDHLTPKGMLSAGMLLAVLALAVFVAATGAIWPALQVSLADLSTLQLGLLASFVAGMFTAVGAIPIFFLRRVSREVEDSLMGFGAGGDACRDGL
jgi:zinc transporter, ZIP family